MHPPPSVNGDRPDLSGSRAHDAIPLLLRAAREHLDLDVAFVGEFIDGQRVFRYVDGRFDVDLVRVGEGDPLEESYCHYVATGRLPGFLLDPKEEPLTLMLAGAEEPPVGTHLSVPIQFSDGRIYGTFCCFALDVRRELHRESMRSMRMVADLVGAYLENLEALEADRRQRRQRIQNLVDDPDAVTMVFQPLRDLRTMEIVGLEALARFPGDGQGPGWLFSEAANVGLGRELEMRAVHLTLEELGGIPPPLRVNINVSPETLCSAEFFDAVRGVPRDRVVVEVTEHAAIEDYAELRAASASLRQLGIWLAIDDVGMGFSGLNRILESSPEELKLDAVVIRNVDSDPVKHALVGALCSFGTRVGLNIVAEGIETQSELETLQALGAKLGQGYHLGRPDRLDRILHPLASSPATAVQADPAANRGAV